MKLDLKEAPVGFYPVLKAEIKEGNICNHCEARKLCVENKENWCAINRCMSYARNDGFGVFFKLITNE